MGVFLLGLALSHKHLYGGKFFQGLERVLGILVKYVCLDNSGKTLAIQAKSK